MALIVPSGVYPSPDNENEFPPVVGLTNSEVKEILSDWVFDNLPIEDENHYEIEKIEQTSGGVKFHFQKRSKICVVNT